MKIFTRTAVLSFGFAVAIGAAAAATPLASDRDMVTGVSVTEADCRALSGRLWVRAENRGFCVSVCRTRDIYAFQTLAGRTCVPDIAFRVSTISRVHDAARPISKVLVVHTAVICCDKDNIKALNSRALPLYGFLAGPMRMLTGWLNHR